MELIAHDVEDTDRIVAMAEAVLALKKIRHILKNKHNPADQIKAIKKLLKLQKDQGETE